MADPFKCDDLEVATSAQAGTVDSTVGDVTSAAKLVATTNVECVDVDATGDVSGDTGTFTSAATVGGVGVALRGTELDSVHKELAAPFTSAGGGAWETVDTAVVPMSVDGTIMAVASLDAEAAAAVAVAPNFRLVIDGNAMGAVSVDLLATQAALAAAVNGLQAAITAGAINVELQVQDDGVTAVTVNHALITAIGLVQK